MLGVFIIAFLYAALPYTTMLIVFAVCSIIFIGIDFFRLRYKPLNSWIMSIVGNFARRTEVNGLTGVSYLCVGVMTIAIIFPKEIALLSILLLAVGDPISSIFGVMYGKDVLIGKKTLQGSIACFISCTLMAALYYLSTQIMIERVVLAAIITGFIAALSELLPIAGLDDNFTFPILSSCLLWLQFHFMHGF
jgi:dolichol kinase